MMTFLERGVKPRKEIGQGELSPRIRDVGLPYECRLNNEGCSGRTESRRCSFNMYVNDLELSSMKRISIEVKIELATSR